MRRINYKSPAEQQAQKAMLGYASRIIDESEFADRKDLTIRTRTPSFMHMSDSRRIVNLYLLGWKWDGVYNFWIPQFPIPTDHSVIGLDRAVVRYSFSWQTVNIGGGYGALTSD